jgi:hypothetical protein
VHLRRILALVPALLLLAACGGGGGGRAGGGPAPQGTPGGTAPAATVERFLRLAAEKNYAQMGYVFGTAEGAIASRDPAPQVERRMYALASVLENQRFVIRGEQPVPGRSGTAVDVDVVLTQRTGVHSVPFTVVRAGDRWFVEKVDLEKITGA